MQLLQSFEEFENILRAAEGMLVPERVPMLEGYYVDGSNGKMSQLDPFTEAYKAEVLNKYREITGVARYDPSVNEAANYLSIRKSGDRPDIFRHEDSVILGDFYASAGHILQVLNVKAGQTVLEYGAGEGQIAIALARMGCNVYVIDIEPRYLEIIEYQAAQLGISITTRQGAFGDGFEEVAFDRILFFEAFHHAIEHQNVLEKIRSLLKPDGQIVFSGEPILAPDSVWLPCLAYPWGPRLDGLSLAAMRSYGWCELGFQQGYFIDVLMRSGYLVTPHLCKATDRGHCYVATINTGTVDLTQPYLISDWRGRSGWHEAETDHRWTQGAAVMPLPQNIEFDRAEVTLSNYLPFPTQTTITLGDRKTFCDLASAQTLTVSAPRGRGPSHYLEIDTPVTQPSLTFGGADDRKLGVAVSRVTLER